MGLDVLKEEKGREKDAWVRKVSHVVESQRQHIDQSRTLTSFQNKHVTGALNVAPGSVWLFGNAVWELTAHTTNGGTIWDFQFRVWKVILEVLELLSVAQRHLSTACSLSCNRRRGLWATPYRVRVLFPVNLLVSSCLQSHQLNVLNEPALESVFGASC